ncbi:hypothetical protein CEXT_632831 [Caerostris extrusa]|uniref:Uncharacterized protein n=1 Tax=Caerostris extrusa TaxID=172846 RepID=A0AAV4VWY6_CAEEX|nr:hypothetical protein CEXT_632831 [Caerostris extrusa]
MPDTFYEFCGKVQVFNKVVGDFLLQQLLTYSSLGVLLLPPYLTVEEMPPHSLHPGLLSKIKMCTPLCLFERHPPPIPHCRISGRL